jgi:hypothetical protein
VGKFVSSTFVIVITLNYSIHRCEITADGARCTLLSPRYDITHCRAMMCGYPSHATIRQWFDWSMFLASAGVDGLNGRRCALTHCRLLKLRPPVVLPSSIGEPLIPSDVYM